MSLQLLSQIVSTDTLIFGAVAIPERHRDKMNEHIRLYERSQMGVLFFTTQLVYSADCAIWMLEDYDALCKEKGNIPARIVFSFSPFGSVKALEFMRWLGVEVPEGTAKRILSKSSLEARIEASIQVCCENFRKILYAKQSLGLNVPIGFSVESISKSKLEFDGAVKLFQRLKLISYLNIKYEK